MDRAKAGDTVSVHYTGRLDDGTVFDSSREREPLSFKVGEGQVIPGFEKAVVGLAPGESRTINIPADAAYGDYQKEMVAEIERAQIPADLEIEVGQQLQLQQQDGDVLAVTVIDISNDTVTLDGNHPLAGEALEFDIELVSVA